MSIRLEDPIVIAALITGASAVTVAIVNGLFQFACTWMQNRSKKPASRKPRRKQRKKRRYLSDQARPPPPGRDLTVADVDRPGFRWFVEKRWCYTASHGGRCALFGCEVDVDVVLSDALAPGWRWTEPCGAGGHLAYESPTARHRPVSAPAPAVDRGRWLSRPAHIIAHVTKLANLRTAP